MLTCLWLRRKAARAPLQERTATDVQRQMRAAMAPAPYASSSEGGAAAPASQQATSQPQSLPDRDDPAAAVAAFEPRDEPRGLGLLTRLARQRGVVIVSSSGSDRSSGCTESPDRYDLNAALQARSQSAVDFATSRRLTRARLWRRLGLLSRHAPQRQGRSHVNLLCFVFAIHSGC